jgi:hypothetical protein
LNKLMKTNVGQIPNLGSKLNQILIGS